MTGRSLDDLVDEALNLEPASWPRFLDEACGGDRELRAEAESLLAMHAAYPEVLMPGPPATAARPASIGRYTIHREIARGGMGVVYEASDETLDRRIALKVLPARLAGDIEWLRRFGREAKHLAAMDHPAIANVYTLEESGGLHFLTMELVESDPLSTHLEAGPLPLPRALHVGRQLAGALEAVHRKGIVHCDLKPANILLSDDDRVTVIDFGLARRRAVSPHAMSHSGSDTRSGTPGFMAPEQITGGEIDRRADVWAFGCVMYQCVTGHPAFPGDAAERMRATLDDAPEWGRLPDAFPLPLRELLARCLDKSVDDRLDDATRIRRAFEKATDPTDDPSDGDDHPGNLPRWSNAFLGREDAVRSLAKRLDSTRLLTLTGPGGCGKTRLAAHVGRARSAAHPGGVWFVDLRSATTDDQVLETVSAVLDLAPDPTRPILDSIVDGLATRHILLILDNCEHRLNICRAVADRLLAGCDGVSMLATSREPLSTREESVYEVPPLLRPDPAVAWAPEDLADIGSVRLFLARAAEASPGFELTGENAQAVAGLCHALEGIPLAIELAASRAGTLALEDLTEGLDVRRGMPMAGPGDASRTLDALIEWSYDLLSPSERTLFARLSVFAGGWTLDAAETVCTASGVDRTDVGGLITRLRRKSLVGFDVGARPIANQVRFRMLEPIRSFASRALPDPERRPLRLRHAERFVELAEEAAPLLRGSERTTWLSTLESEHDNVRAALDFCLEEETDPLLGLRFVGALELFWEMRGHWTDATGYGDALLAREGADVPSAARGHALNAAALFHMNTGRPDRADRYYDEALAIGRTIEDPALTARSIHNKGGIALSAGRLPEARARFEEYLEMKRAEGDVDAQARVTSNLGVVAEREERFDDARTLYEGALDLLATTDNPRMEAVLLNNLGSIELRLGRYDEARRRLEASLAMHREAEDPWNIAAALNLLGAVAEEEGDTSTAMRYFRQSLRLMQELGNLSGVCTLLTQIGVAAIRAGAAHRGAVFLSANESLRTRIGEPLPPDQVASITDATAAARTSLGDEAFNRAWTEGAKLTTDDAVRLALDHEDPPAT